MRASTHCLAQSKPHLRAPWGFILVFLLAANSARAASCGISPTDGSLFWIGKPDGAGQEFGLARERWPSYLKKFPQPVVFTVGQDGLAAWPYIHPSRHDEWAG